MVAGLGASGDDQKGAKNKATLSLKRAKACVTQLSSFWFHSDNASPLTTPHLDLIECFSFPDTLSNWNCPTFNKLNLFVFVFVSEVGV